MKEEFNALPHHGLFSEESLVCMDLPFLFLKL